MTYRSPEDFAKETGEILRLLRGLVRRMVVTFANGARWQLLGQRGGTAGDEVVNVEAFTGIGFYSRPPSSGSPEAIVAAVGGAKHQVIVATRDEATRQAAAGAIVDGETMVYNDKACIYVKADGTVEIRLVGGVAVPLATKADVQALANYLQKQFTSTTGHVHATPSGPTTTITEGAGSSGTPGTAPNPAGTTVIKGQ